MSAEARSLVMFGIPAAPAICWGFVEAGALWVPLSNSSEKSPIPVPAGIPLAYAYLAHPAFLPIATNALSRSPVSDPYVQSKPPCYRGNPES